MERVAVVGSGGAGKTTFATELGRRTGLPVLHLDRFYWRPGWVVPDEAEWAMTQSELVERPEWIIDGNYGTQFDLRFAQADTVIVLAPPRRVCVYRALKRMVVNWHRDVQAPGCREHFDFEFLRWLWGYQTNSRPQLDAALARHRDSIEVIELTTRRDVRRYLDGLTDTPEES
jgi:adenylate kinase family enzyme